MRLRSRLWPVVLAGLTLTVAAPARAADPVVQYDLPEQSLGASLNILALRNHLQLSYDNAVAALNAPPLTGAFTLNDALEKLLAGSGLVWRSLSTGVILVEQGKVQEAHDAPAPRKARAPRLALTPVNGVDEVIVTGSRIRGPDVAAPTALSQIDAVTIEDRGFVQVGQALNQMTAMTPSIPITNFTGGFSGPGTQYPALFGLGAGRTLSLIDGHRIVTTASGLDDASVDTNLIPLGLLERVDIVPGGGGAVYGSDAIAGVVNYVMKDHFTGVEVDTQAGISTYGDYPVDSVRATVGTDFLNHKGNVAADFEWSKSNPLLTDARPETARAYATAPNPADTGASTGVTPTIGYFDRRFWIFNANGIVFSAPSPTAGALLQVGGAPAQFNAGGTALVPYDTGAIRDIFFAQGGQGYPYQDITALLTGVERDVANVIGHYDIADHLKFSTEMMVARSEGDDPVSVWVSGLPPSSSSSTSLQFGSFTASNPYLTPAAIAALSAADPGFAAGNPLYLGKFWNGLPATQQSLTNTRIYRGLWEIAGDFDAGGRNYYWSVSYGHGVVRSGTFAPAVNIANFQRALDTTRNAAGEIVCAVNAVTTTDPACAPLDPFGASTVTSAAAAYITTDGGESYRNTQEDALATLGGAFLTLPAGDAKFSATFEHRAATAQFVPTQAAQLGLVGVGAPTPPQSGEYHTNEYAAEILVPVLGDARTLPFVQAAEVSGAFRHVDNSVTASEEVWNAGLRWQIVPDIGLRGSLSRNFRAPTLNQLFAPAVTSLGSIGYDPCDSRYIGMTSAFATRLANCQALFAAHPQWGPLSAFQDPAVNSAIAYITTGGNPNLVNEVSHTQSIGAVLKPRFAEGLSVSIDHIAIHLANGLSQAQTGDSLQACFDSAPQPLAAPVCNVAVRDPATGYVVAGKTTIINAGSIRYRGETYNVAYDAPVGRLIGSGKDYGTIDIALEATHTGLLETSVAGVDLTRTDGTIAQPAWLARLNLQYSYGAWRVTYQAFYRAPALYEPGASAATTPTPEISANVIQDISAQYAFAHLTLRAGINNVLNQRPSFPTLTYGDIVGRAFFAGATLHY